MELPDFSLFHPSRPDDEKRVIEPEIVIEGGQTIKRYPPMWADGTGFGVTARPRVKPRRND